MHAEAKENSKRVNKCSAYPAARAMFGDCQRQFLEVVKRNMGPAIVSTEVPQRNSVSCGVLPVFLRNLRRSNLCFAIWW